MRWIIVLMLAGTCWGQTTQPLVNENSKLRAENSRLKKWVAELTAQVDQLTAERDGLLALVNSPSPTTAPTETPIQAATKEGMLAVGMTLAEAEKAAGRGFLTEEYEGGIQIYKFDTPDHRFSAQFDSGKITSYQLIRKPAYIPGTAKTEERRFNY